jgi:serine/threonine protein kinase
MTTPAAGDASPVEQFEDAWQRQAAPDIAVFLPAPSHPGRRSMLLELIAVDLDHRWRSVNLAGPPDADGGSTFKRPRLEDYARRFPEIGPANELPADLIAEEYQVRHCWGDRPGHAEYRDRFPDRWGQVELLLGRLDAELADELRGKDRPPTGGPAIPPTAGPVLIAEPIDGPVTVSDLLELLRSTAILSLTQLNELILANIQGRLATPAALLEELKRRAWLTSYQTEQIQAGAGRGLSLGPYVILGLLGEGGGGQVFKAMHRKMNRVVALKLIRQDWVGDTDLLRRFYREIEMVSQLRHSNLVHALDGGPVDGRHVLVMEFLEGTDLARLVRQSGPLPVSQACAFIRQAAAGLQHIHAHGLVHRDIKPHNLMAVASGQSPLPSNEKPAAPPAAGHRPPTTIKILDLGLARMPRTTAVGGTGTITDSGTVMMGTLDYMAPEQALDFHAADIRADIYSLGCTLHYLLAGEPPFPGGTPAQKLLRHQLEWPASIDARRPDVPPALTAVLRRMLAKRAEDRFQTPAEVAAALVPWAAGTVPQSDPTWMQGELPGSGAAPLPPARSRHRPSARPLGIALVVGLGLLATAGGFWALSPRKPVVHSVPGALPRTMPVRTVLFSNGFATGKLDRWRVPQGADWRLVPGPTGAKQALTGGILAPRPAEAWEATRLRSVLAPRDGSWGDGVIRASAYFDFDATTPRRAIFGANVYFRMQGPENLYWYEFNSKDGKSGLYLCKLVRGQFTELASRANPAGIVPRRWYRLRLELRGPDLRAFLDDQLMLVVPDESHRSGTIGLSRTNFAPGPDTLWEDVGVEPLPAVAK